jgi:hypothetical protein
MLIALNLLTVAVIVLVLVELLIIEEPVTVGRRAR